MLPICGVLAWPVAGNDERPVRIKGDVKLEVFCKPGYHHPHGDIFTCSPD